MKTHAEPSQLGKNTLTTSSEMSCAIARMTTPLAAAPNPISADSSTVSSLGIMATKSSARTHLENLETLGSADSENPRSLRDQPSNGPAKMSSQVGEPEAARLGGSTCATSDQELEVSRVEERSRERRDGCRKGDYVGELFDGVRLIQWEDYTRWVHRPQGASVQLFRFAAPRCSERSPMNIGDG